jgi:hypothetical protein
VPVNPRKLRILFIDDEYLPIVDTFKQEGYDVSYMEDIDNLENLIDGRYQVIFFDVRGIGKKYGGNGLDAVEYVAKHNPLIHRIVFSAKPFSASELERARRSADLCVTKDSTFYDLSAVVEHYANSLSPAFVLERISKTMKLSWWQRKKLVWGLELGKSDLSNIAKSSGMASDAISIVANTIAIAAALIGLAS